MNFVNAHPSMPAKPFQRKRPAVRRAAAARGLVYVTRQVHFNAAHRLHNPGFSAAWNGQRFGACANPNWHGHNYVLEATVRSPVDPRTGFVLELSALKALLTRAVVEPCDHRNLNEDVDFLKGTIPSTENLVVAFWKRIEPLLPKGVELHQVRLYETPRHFADYFGP